MSGTTIAVSREVHSELDELRATGQSFDGILREILNGDVELD